MSESIGERIKALRIERGMTLAELGEIAKLSTSYISQIEREKTTPSLPTLMEIAKALEVAPRCFFESETEGVYIIRSDYKSNEECVVFPVNINKMTPDSRSSKLEVSKLVLQANSTFDLLDQYYGEEFNFVLSGKVRLNVGDEEYNLEAGDSIHYDAYQPRYWCNNNDEKSVVILARVASIRDL
jgi:transcriptional regulator with XRE-family HTH domain